jgi:very-short-patch-repair endonuclease
MHADWLDEVMPLRVAGDEQPRVVRRAAALRFLGRDAIDYRCRSGRCLRLAPSVYLTAPPARPWDRMQAAFLHAGPASVISGSAALFACDFRAVPAMATVMALVPLCAGAANWRTIRVRRTARLPEARWRMGVPLAPVARAVADYVLELRHVERVQAVVAEAIQRQLCTVAELTTELESGPRRGSRLFREALGDVGYGARSVPEARAGRLLRRTGLTGFEQNVEILVRGRRFVADFLWRDLRAVLEIDSTEYHLSPRDHEATLERDQLMQAGGYAVLHVKPSQLRDPVTFVGIVRDWLASLSRRAS